MIIHFCDRIINPLRKDYFVKITGFCYQSVNDIIFDLAQSDHNKRRALHYRYKHMEITLKNSICNNFFFQNTVQRLRFNVFCVIFKLFIGVSFFFFRKQNIKMFTIKLSVLMLRLMKAHLLHTIQEIKRIRLSLNYPQRIIFYISIRGFG